MLYTFPDYYEKFKCIGTDCPDTCCACWEIVADDKSLKNYIKYRGKFKKQLLKNINFFKKTFRQTDNLRCAFLNRDNLCNMQLQMGEAALCRTCTNYPRHIEEFENVREISLSVSCPVVAEILLNDSNKTDFISVERDNEEEFKDFDLLLYSKLCDARSIMIEILQNREIPIELRMQVSIAFGHDIQGRINRNEIFSFEEVFEKYQDKKIFEKARKYAKKYNENFKLKFDTAKVLFNILFEFEHLKKDWIELLNDVYDILYDKNESAYSELSDEFDKWIKDNDTGYDIKMEQLLVYFIFTYFCGSVYDEKVYQKVFMSVIGVFLIQEILKAVWFLNDRKFTEKDYVNVVYRFSRELEHSDVNLELFERSAFVFKDLLTIGII